MREFAFTRIACSEALEVPTVLRRVERNAESMGRPLLMPRSYCQSTSVREVSKRTSIDSADRHFYPGEAKTDAREAFVIADAARVFAMLRDGTFDEDQPAGTGA
ncbi:hypothetical protein ACWD7C_40615 [Streptomyces sp. NPDC005134]|uniref:hypothetical protein n=1 Tax=Streptomyces sp. NPDC005098 TaxID=3154560 RepID=UPI0033AFA73B